MDFLKGVAARAVTPAARMFGMVSSKPEPDAKIEKKIKAIEEYDDKAIQPIAETAAEKNANKAKLNRALTNYLNDSRNSIPAEPPVAAPVAAVLPPDLTPDAVASATIDATNNNLALDNKLNEKPSDKVNSEILKENELMMMEKLYEPMRKSMEAFTADQGNITAFKEECVKKAIQQFQDALSAYKIPITDQISGAIMKKIAESWSEFLISTTQGDSSVYLSYKTFFFRVNQAIDALLTQCIFLSTKWAQTFPSPPPPPHGSPPPPPIISTGGVKISYPIVKVGPFWYAIGPILDFKNIEGRIFIYVKCYRTEQCTDGIYFWVYGSQSEGFNRVFFKLDPFGAIEKGFDYTQGTFVHLRLQMELCSYYDIHYRQGIRNPIKIDTLTRLNYFMSYMPYLQVNGFLDKFPGAIIEPSFYSKVSTGVDVVKCAKGEAKDDCCYVCLTKLYVKPVVLTPPFTQSPGMIGHYYIIDYSFRFIIRKGFPLHPPNFTDNDWSGVINMICKKRGLDVNRDNQLLIARELQGEWTTQRTIFPRDASDITNPFYDFSRIEMGYVTTCPYIFCFTTCGLIQSCPMFKLFLSANSYKTTFWCQGFQNYTKMLSVDPNREILSPVLYVVIGALLQDADMRLSTLRNIILNIGIMADDKTISQIYNKATKAFMTLGTRNFGDPDTSLYLPNIPIRSAALLAFKKISYKIYEIYESFKKKNNSPSVEDTKIVEPKVEKKINMIQCLAQIYTQHKGITPTHPFVGEVNRLLDFHPEHKNTLLQRISAAADAAQPVTGDSPATGFITQSPEAAAAALFGYIYDPVIFKKDLTDLANICLKKYWSNGVMDDAYHALEGVFNPNGAIYNYLGKDGVFHEFDPAAPPPPPAPAPYVFISSFDEVRKEDTSPTSPDRNLDGTTTELNVTVVTFAHIYRVDCGYHEVFANGDSDLLKSMSILYQISTTVVYTRENPSRILYAVTHRTPLACLPDLPDALEYLIPKFSNPTGMGGGTKPGKKIDFTSVRDTPVIRANLRVRINNKKNKEATKTKLKDYLKEETKATQTQLTDAAEQAKKEAPSKKMIADKEQKLLIANRDHPLTSPYTLLATYKRVASYGAFFAGKMMEYFFGGENGYYQLPYFFRNFDKFLKVCHQYDSTVLMYKYDVPPYNLLHPLPNAQPLLDASIQLYFTGLGITFQGDSIGTKLEKNTKDIQAIFEYLTGDFMVDPGILDDVNAVRDDSQLSASTNSTTSSIKSTASRRDEELDKLLPFFGDIPGNKKNLHIILFGSPLPEEDQSDIDYIPDDDDDDDDSSDNDGSKGGTLPIKNHIKKSITTRKKKNKNKSRTKTNSRNPVRRVTIRIKRMMKSKGSKFTKPRTYKRRATGGKRKSKPNKTMRRYRRVRK